MMKQTSDTRYPFKRMTAEFDGPNCVLKAVHPGKRIVVENRCAAPGANVILILPRG